MSWRSVRRMLLITVLGVLVLEAIRSLRGPEAPAFSRHPSAWDGQTARPEPVSAAPTSAEEGPAPTAEPHAAADESWAAPVDGACPPGFPIKAKERSGIYHEPGMLAYDRTKPDRCYASAADARAGGFRAAKR